jgi:hypothetical protein
LPSGLSLLICGSVFADSQNPPIKSWKTFKSDVGYEFKYPDCWKVGFGDVNEQGPLWTLKYLSVLETERCSRKEFSTSSPKGIGFSVGNGDRGSRKSTEKEIALREKNAPGDLQRKEKLAFTKIKLGSADALAWVQVEAGYLQWQVKLYCPDWWISVAGPMINNANIDPTLYDKFKKGDLAMPEPEKTVVESIRCIPAKQKTDKG